MSAAALYLFQIPPRDSQDLAMKTSLEAAHTAWTIAKQTT
jgi:hypothetical protein